MKLNFVIFTLLFLGVSFTGTTQEITYDTVYFEQSSDQLYRVTRIEYSNGSYYVSKEAATKAQILDVYSGSIETDMANLAEAARVILTTQVVFNKSVRLNNSLNSSLQISPLRELQLKYETPFLNTASSTVWRLNSDERIANVTFTKNIAGFLIAKVGDDSNRSVVLAGQVMRFNNYPSQGNVTFFYKIRDGLWRTIDGSIDIRLVRAVERK